MRKRDGYRDQIHIMWCGCVSVVSKYTPVSKRVTTLIITFLVNDGGAMTAVYFSTPLYNPGDTGVSYVADSGVELFRHPHSNILRCATGTDGITFSYIVQDETQQCSCHVFQCLTPDEVRVLPMLSLFLTIFSHMPPKLHFYCLNFVLNMVYCLLLP